MTSEDRETTIDAVRGFAVLGILLMNIVGMGMPGFAYIDPHYWGGAEGANLWTWGVNYVLVDGKMRGLFTMLFGASLILVTERAARSGQSPAKVHYSRMAWLLVFGLAHGWLIWFGDILYDYALVGMAAFLLRKRPAWLLLLLGAMVTLAFAGYGLFIDVPHLQELRAAATAPGASAEAVKAWQDQLGLLAPPPEMLNMELAGYRGGFADAFQARMPYIVLFETAYFLAVNLWDVLGFMLIGMGLYKLGFFSGRWTTRAYLIVIALGYLVAAPLYWPVVQALVSSRFDLLVTAEANAFVAVARLPIALAHASVVILAIRAWPASAAVTRLAAAGRMALSNYLAANIIATTVFYGYGGGLYGHLERHQLYYVVAAIWVLELLWSKPWLDRFQYGPFEWLWRSLARWKPQPMRKSATTAAAA